LALPRRQPPPCCSSRGSPRRCRRFDCCFQRRLTAPERSPWRPFR
jgi:hypothetical protein